MLRPVSVAFLSSLCSTVALAGATQPIDAGPLVGDGETPASMQVMLPAGARLKASTDQGVVQQVLPIPGGAVITWIPPKVKEPTKVPLLFKVRGGGVKEDVTFEANVMPAWTGGFDITFDPPIAKPGGTVSVKVRPNSPGATTSGTRTVHGSVSHGELTPLVAGSDGSWVARYTAPTELEAPIRPLFFIADMAAPTQVFSTAPLAVTLERSVTLDAPADSNNMLKVGDREYGPVKASPAGKVAFDIDLHPDQLSGELTSAPAAGEPITTTPNLPVEVPTSVVLMPMAAKAGSTTDVSLLIACRTGADATCSPADVNIEASGGKVALITADGDTMLRTTWTAPSDGTATLNTNSGGQSHLSTVEVVAGPLFLTMSSDPRQLADGEKDFKLVVRAKDLQGKAVTKRAPVFKVPDSRLIKRPAGAEDGSYTGSWRLNTDASGTQATAWAKIEATGLPVQRIVAWPAHDVVNVESGGNLLVYIAAEDATGMPVPNVQLSLAVPVGDGSMVGSVKTDASGVAAVPYSIGAQPGPVRIDISGAGLSTATHVWQQAAGNPPPQVHKTGSTTKHEAIERWRKRIATVAVGAGAAKPTAAAPIVAAATPVVGPGTPPPTGPGPTTPAVVGPTANTKPAKQPRTPQGYSWLRLRGQLTEAPFTYSAVAKGDPQGYAPEAKFSSNANIGVHLDGELWIGSSRNIGVDVRSRFGIYRVNIGNTPQTVAPTEFELGGRYRAWDNGTWSAYAGLGVANSKSMVFEYADESRTAAIMKPYAVTGLRAGGGLRGEFGASLLDVNLQTVWAPGPAIIRAEVIGELPLMEKLLLTGAVAGNTRFSSYSTSEAKEDKIKVNQSGLDIRVGVAIPFF